MVGGACYVQGSALQKSVSLVTKGTVNTCAYIHPSVAFMCGSGRVGKADRHSCGFERRCCRRGASRALVSPIHLLYSPLSSSLSRSSRCPGLGRIHFWMAIDSAFPATYLGNR